MNAGAGGSNGGAGGSGGSRTADMSKLYWAGGGAGNPGGNGASPSATTTAYVGNNASYKGQDGTGGLLIMYADVLTNNGTISSQGAYGYPSSSVDVRGFGGCSGAGSINLYYKTSNTVGTTNVAGLSQKYGSSSTTIKNGGAGTCNWLKVAF